MEVDRATTWSTTTTRAHATQHMHRLATRVVALQGSRSRAMRTRAQHTPTRAQHTHRAHAHNPRAPQARPFHAPRAHLSTRTASVPFYARSKRALSAMNVPFPRPSARHERASTRATSAFQRAPQAHPFHAPRARPSTRTTSALPRAPQARPFHATSASFHARHERAFQRAPRAPFHARHKRAPSTRHERALPRGHKRAPDLPRATSASFHARHERVLLARHVRALPSRHERTFPVHHERALPCATIVHPSLRHEVATNPSPRATNAPDSMHATSAPFPADDERALPIAPRAPFSHERPSPLTSSICREGPSFREGMM
jgi:hypothetical protein